MIPTKFIWESAFREKVFVIWLNSYKEEDT
jgi:hypothetical protein